MDTTRRGHIAPVFWGDHLAFGEGNSRLDTSDAIARRMKRGQHRLGAGQAPWRVFRRRIPGPFEAAPSHIHPSQAPLIAGSELEVVPELARRAGPATGTLHPAFDALFVCLGSQSRPAEGAVAIMQVPSFGGFARGPFWVEFRQE